MTIEKLARFLVESDYDGGGNDERFQISVERETKRLLESMSMGWNGSYYVEVEVEDVRREIR
jgi:hypothetical protein